MKKDHGDLVYRRTTHDDAGYVLADDMAEDELIATEVEDLDETLDSADSLVEDVTDYAEAPIAEENIGEGEAEEVVGKGEIWISDGVTATFDSDTGTFEFFSDNGTLHNDWAYWAGLDKNKIKSIRVKSGILHLLADSSGMFMDCCILTNLDLRASIHQT